MMWALLAFMSAALLGCYDFFITIRGEKVTKQTMAEAAQQQLKYTAYAAQSANLTAAEAWAQLNPTP